MVIFATSPKTAKGTHAVLAVHVTSLVETDAVQ
jgi:hypothetical protein